MATNDGPDKNMDDPAWRLEQVLPEFRSIHTERLRRLFVHTYERIEGQDRDILTDSIFGLHETHEPGPGSLTPVSGSVLIDHVDCVEPRDLDIGINAGYLDRYDDDAYVAAIARLLARAILRHLSTFSPFLIIAEHHDLEIQQQARVHQWDADCQVWLWGFGPELRALWKANGEAEPPWYHQFDPDPGPQ